MIHLLARHRVLATRRLSFEQNAIVGRGQHCELILETPNVSGFHARFEVRPSDGALLVSDLDSSNGTYLSGRRIGAIPEEMSPEDRVLVGDWTFTFATGDPARPFDGRSARETELFHGLLDKPNDDELRQVYSDWLEESGHAKEVEVLSLERQMRRADGRIDTVEHGRLAFRLRMLAEQLPPAWCAAVMRPPIEGCPYSDKCPRDWDALHKLPDPFVRRCATCKEEVRFDEGRARRGGNSEITTAVDESKVTGLPFFAADTPPTTIGALFRGLRVPPPQGLNDSTGMFTVDLPAGRIQQVRVRFAWDVGNDMPLRRFADVEFAPVNDVTVVFTGDADEIEEWLRARFGPPHDATQSLWPGAPMPMQTRAYGNWIFRNEGTGCRLNWFRIRPGWDLPVDHEDIACEFVRELDERLRTGCSPSEMTEFASLPPRHSGIVVRGLQGDAFWLTFEPRIRAVALTQALGLVDPIGTRNGGQGRSWRVVEAARTTPSRLRQDGNWILEIMLEGSASGRVRENDRQLSGADRALGIRLRRPIAV